ncbi:MAG: cytidine deaminase [Vulcanimicrobiaceae bacterium]
MAETTDTALLDAARLARKHAYGPYSAYDVGAALLCDDGTIVTACNVENASYGLSMCAERAAVFAAVAGGHRRVWALANAGPPRETTAPCGACRQVLAEFGTSTRVLFTTSSGFEEMTVAALLPAAFVLPE